MAERKHSKCECKSGAWRYAGGGAWRIFDGPGPHAGWYAEMLVGDGEVRYCPDCGAQLDEGGALWREQQARKWLNARLKTVHPELKNMFGELLDFVEPYTSGAVRRLGHLLLGE